MQVLWVFGFEGWIFGGGGVIWFFLWGLVLFGFFTITCYPVIYLFLL